MIPIKGPYYNLTRAAEYCGYSRRTFSDKVRQYAIPRHGDESNRFSVADLDRWMEDPKCFVKEKRTLPVRRYGGFTPVSV